MSCFIVPNSFNSHETIVMLQLIKLFQQPMLLAAGTTSNQQPIASCSRVSVVSLLIHLLDETEKVFNLGDRGCIPMVIGRHDSTQSSSSQDFPNN